MALPKLQTPTYELVLPSTNEKIKYRPFLVKEQKILLMSQESGQENDIANAVGNLAEEQNHHPDIYLAWGKVRVAIWTHKINGLTESDFVFAAKSDDLSNL